jgi:ribosomal protein S27E
MKCGHIYMAIEGCGWSFFVLHCDRCGKYKDVPFFLIQNITGKEDYRGEVAEEIAGYCNCGGHYRMDAPIRCPKCGSTRYEETGGYSCLFD